MKVPKDDVVALLTRMGQAMRAAGDGHRARAYLGAANAVERAEAFEALYDKGKLQELSGIGPAIEKKIVAFVEKGEVPDWVDDASKASERASKGGSAVTGARAEAGSAEEVASIPKAYHKPPFADAPDLHVHTTWSDGTLTIDEVVAFAKRLGAKAIGISDHSGSLRIARGLQPHEVRAQWKEIERVQREHPDVLILRGTECDILRYGALDHPADLLAEFDYVIGSLHSHLKLSEREQTERVLTALDEEHLTVLGHPTTRVPNRRAPANMDLDAVFEKAAARGVAMEVNGNPGRIDLDAKLAQHALEAGCKLSLASDAHSAREMLAHAKARLLAAEAGAKKTDLVNYDVLTRRSGALRAKTRKASKTLAS